MRFNFYFVVSSRRRHTRSDRDWSSDVCSSDLFRDLRDWGLSVCGHLSFPDHHRYTEEEVLQIELGAKRAGANAFVTTEKDEQNLSGLRFGHSPVYVSVIDLGDIHGRVSE